MNDPGLSMLTNSTQELSQRATDVALKLRSRILEVAREVAGPAVRPSRISLLLGLDKNLASRISRSLRSDSAYELLHLIPSPTGLGMFLDRAEERGGNTKSLQAAREAVAEFHDLLGHLSGGRVALDALMSETVIEVRERAERIASQSVYRGMSYLLGFRCETITSAVILHPSADGAMVDGLDVSRREGIRRLRPSSPVALFSVDLTGEVPQESTRLELLNPADDPSDPRSILLSEFCDPKDPSLELYTTGTHTVFALSNEDKSLQRGVTISSGFYIRNGYLRWRLGDQDEEVRSYLLHYPCKLLIRDIFIHDDIYQGVEPQIRLEFPAPPGAPRPRADNPAVRLNQLDISVPIVSLGRGLQRAAAAGSSQHLNMLTHAFQTAGLDPKRFRGYRVRIMYPVPMITLGWWIPLPPAP